ncbi:MutT/nudix [Bacillus thuringiensis]|uniref:MutT/nudix n=2 Tax=Bacillus thuringiensis TaxID=1428 RepID=A0A9W3SA88_BACTU|nr:MutT/nudix [Bacillus thuringiensis]
MKLTNGDEFYPITIAYLCKDITGGLLKADGVESLHVQFFNLNELPQNISPFIKKLIEQNVVSVLTQKRDLFKGLFYFTSACKQDLKCPSANSCPCALKDATAFS